MSYAKVRDRIREESDTDGFIDRLKNKLVIKKIELYDAKSLENEIKNQYSEEEFSRIFGNNSFSQIHYRVLLYLLRDFTMEKVIREEELNLGQTSEDEINTAALDIEKYLEHKDMI